GSGRVGVCRSRSAFLRGGHTSALLRRSFVTSMRISLSFDMLRRFRHSLLVKAHVLRQGYQDEIAQFVMRLVPVKVMDTMTLRNLTIFRDPDGSVLKLPTRIRLHQDVPVFL